MFNERRNEYLLLETLYRLVDSTHLTLLVELGSSKWDLEVGFRIGIRVIVSSLERLESFGFRFFGGFGLVGQSFLGSVSQRDWEGG
ncbi:unnamed protein product [Allacma fusca]|uniref:Uncharacterized protein n=1 Tax=Allacma fusca TaxID=39272 RepID=A0A8J2PJ39_9HEXA|nr:unnamed protein product [Allacma fusca]